MTSSQPGRTRVTTLSLRYGLSTVLFFRFLHLENRFSRRPGVVESSRVGGAMRNKCHSERINSVVFGSVSSRCSPYWNAALTFWPRCFHSPFGSVYIQGLGSVKTHHAGSAYCRTMCLVNCSFHVEACDSDNVPHTEAWAGWNERCFCLFSLIFPLKFLLFIWQKQLLNAEAKTHQE